MFTKNAIMLIFKMDYTSINYYRKRNPFNPVSGTKHSSGARQFIFISVRALVGGGGAFIRRVNPQFDGSGGVTPGAGVNFTALSVGPLITMTFGSAQKAT